MSGIMGIYYLNGGSVKRQDLMQMLDVLAYRGPDGADMWLDESIGLAHRMLWTTPESLLEKQPLIDSRGDLAIVADARIDNREELVSVLSLADRPLEKITDSEFILAAYERWCEQCPEHLIGDFAFTIWDRRKQSLFCARDHFGVKPFYYHCQPHQGFFFASEIKALLCLTEVPSHLNEVRIADFLALMMEDKSITTYKDILRLPPAHSMIVNRSEVRLWSYWSLDPNREVKLESDEEYAEQFKKIFTEAVRCRLRSAFPIISHLSGGLDSSAVTCVARDLMIPSEKNQLHTISSIFDRITECDERLYIDAVLEQGGYIPHYVSGDTLSPLSNLDRIFQHEDEALLGPSHFYPWNLNRTIKDLGLRICLDGFDGDTTVCHGMSRLTELASQGKWTTFIQEAKAVSQHFNFSPSAMLRGYGLPYLKNLAQQWRWIEFARAVQLIHKHFGSSRKQLIVHHGLKPVLPQALQKLFVGRRQQGKSVSPTSQTSLVNRNFAESVGLDERIQKLDIPSNQPLTVREEHCRNLTQGILVYTLEQMDRCAATFSVEPRHPFMDKRLIEFCLALPSEQKLYQGWSRTILRRGLAGILPEKIRWRGGKTDLTPNFNDGFLNRDRQLLDEVMSHKVKYLTKYIDIDFLQAAYQRIISPGNRITSNDSIVVWQAVILTLWLEFKGFLP